MSEGCRVTIGFVDERIAAMGANPVLLRDTGVKPERSSTRGERGNAVRRGSASAGGWFGDHRRHIDRSHGGEEYFRSDLRRICGLLGPE